MLQGAGLPTSFPKGKVYRFLPQRIMGRHVGQTIVKLSRCGRRSRNGIGARAMTRAHRRGIVNRLPASAALVALTIASASAVFAGEQTVTVTFDPGKASKQIKSTITGEADIDYLVAAKQDQVLHVLFSTTKGTCYFNAFEPGNSDAAVHIGSSAGNEFGASPTKAGTYRFQVYQMRASARRNETCSYTISFELTGEGKGAAMPVVAPAQSGPSEVAKGACLYKIGTDADIVESTALKPGSWKIVMKTKAGGKTAACTVTNDGKVTNWVPAK